MIFFVRYNMLIMSGLFVVVALILYQVSNIEPVRYPTFIIQGAVFLDDVIIYIAALEILKFSLKERRVLTTLQYRQADFSFNQTRLLALISAFPFGLGVSSFLKGLSKKDIDTKPISEGMTASMLIYPTTLASGFVFDSFGLSSLPALFLFGLPVVIVIFLASFKKPLSSFIKSRMFVITTILGFCNYIYLLALSQYIPQYFMIKQAFFHHNIAYLQYKNCCRYSLRIMGRSK